MTFKLVLLAVLSVAFLAGLVKTQGTGEVDGLINIFCNKDEAVINKVATCLADLPDKAKNAQTECRAEAAPDAGEGDFNSKLCSGDRTVAERMVKCVASKRAVLASELDEKELRSALKSLLCLRKLGASLKKD